MWNDVLNVLLYADDVVLKEMLNAVTEYGRDFDDRFSKKKSQVMVVNGDDFDSDKTLILSVDEIKRTKGYKYLYLVE